MHAYSDLERDQLDCIDFIASGEDSLVAADIGTGKTVIALTAAKEMLGKKKVERFLVLAPLLVATDTWAGEFEGWAHLKGLRYAVAHGTPEQRLKAVESDAQFVMLNYENLQWLMEQYPKTRRGDDPLPFDGLICDELDKLKDVSSERFKKFRNRVKAFAVRIGLTGTLIPNDITEIWGQTYVVDAGQSFGRSFYAWRKEHFYPIDFNQRTWLPLPGTEDYVLETIADLAYRLKAKGLPPVVEMPPHKLQLPAAIRNIYKELEKELFLVLDDKAGRRRKIDAKNAAVLSGKLQQICAGFSYVPPIECPIHGLPVKLNDKGKYLCQQGHRVHNDALWHSHARFEWLHSQLIPSLGDEQLLVFYHFREELDELRRRYPDLHYLGGGVTPKRARNSIAEWNHGNIGKLALHPASAGHGLNLQLSGAHNIAALTMPWSGGLYAQLCGRLARRGQTAKEVFVHTALFDDTIDLSVFNTVTGRREGMNQFLDRLEHITRSGRREAGIAMASDIWR